MSNAITVSGIEEISLKLKKIADAEGYKRALGKACAIVERAAKEKAPKGNSGNLRNSIKSEITTDSDGNLIGTVFTNLDYAPYVEFGTGMFAEGGKGRKEVPWVYVEGSSSESKSKKVYTEQEAVAAVEFLQEKGLDAKLTYGEHPCPFMRPALHENKQNILRILKEGASDQ